MGIGLKSRKKVEALAYVQLFQKRGVGGRGGVHVSLVWFKLTCWFAPSDVYLACFHHFLQNKFF